FLRLAPNVTHVRIYPPMKHVEWLRPLKRLQTLIISRGAKNLKVLRELTSLENISFPGWPPGADGLFALPQLVHVGLSRFGFCTLDAMANWRRLQNLYLAGGPLDDLTGVPPTVRLLNLYGLRKLQSLRPLANCVALENL